jgi:hypothetical protein
MQLIMRKSFVEINRWSAISSSSTLVAPSDLQLTLDACSMEDEAAARRFSREIDVERIFAAVDTLCGVNTPSLNVLAQQSNAAALATMHEFVVGTSRVYCTTEIQEMMQGTDERVGCLPVLLGKAGPVLHQLQQQRPMLQQTAAKLGVVSHACESLALVLHISASMSFPEAPQENTTLKQQLVRRIEAAGATQLGCNMIAQSAALLLIVGNKSAAKACSAFHGGSTTR